MTASTAPGSTLQPLGGGMTLGSLTDWRVDTGDAEQRTGHAVVTWKVGAATVKQQYRVQLAAISGGTVG